jgi:hypothetical protein
MNYNKPRSVSHHIPSGAIATISPHEKGTFHRQLPVLVKNNPE